MLDARKGKHVTVDISKNLRGKKEVGFNRIAGPCRGWDPKNLTRTVAQFRISPSLQDTKEKHTPSTPAVWHSNLDAHS
jgi:hypothetical protein